MNAQRNERTYAMGQSEAERQRLQRASGLVGAYTLQLFSAAGIAPGMKVLDVGSGAGDVALLVAGMVGPSGSVIGVDINPQSVEIAQRRAQEAGLANIAFIAGDLREVPLDEDFDAIVGRFILMHLHDPVAVLRRLATHLRPSGVAAFQETICDTTGMTYPPSRLNEQIAQWISQGLSFGGSDPVMGMKLHSVLLEAGFGAPEMVVNGRIGGDRAHIEAITTNQASQVRSLLPLLVQGGYATEDEIGIDTLAARYRDEVLGQGSVLRSFLVVGAWARKAEAK